MISVQKKHLLFLIFICLATNKSIAIDETKESCNRQTGTLEELKTPQEFARIPKSDFFSEASLNGTDDIYDTLMVLRALFLGATFLAALYLVKKTQAWNSQTIACFIPADSPYLNRDN